MANTVDKVLAIAEAEVGYLEKSKAAYTQNNAILDSKTAGAGSDNYTKYGKEMHAVYPAVMDFPAAWCDAFVDWCFYKAYGVATAKSLISGNFDDYTPNSAQMYKNKSAYFKRGNTPKVGDQIFFTNGTRINHTGLVYAVDAKYVYTIEGNTSSGSDVVVNGGGVFKKKYLLTNTKIDGYGRPKYDVEAKPQPTPQSMPVSTSSTSQYYSKYNGSSSASLDTILKAIGVPTEYIGSAAKRKPLAEANGINRYQGSATQNTTLKNLAIQGKLVKVGSTPTTPVAKAPTTTQYYQKYTGTSTSIDTVLKTIGVPSTQYGSVSKRKPLAIANGIVNYSGQASENIKLISLAKSGTLKKA